MPKPSISLPGLLALGAIVLLGGCDSSPTASNPYDEDTRPEDLTYAPALVELGVDFDEMTRTDTGLWYRDFVVGTGAEASVGDSVSVEYTGWLPDGTRFDTGTYDFELASGNVIEGWVEGLEGVRVGGHRLLVIPWWAAYGRSGAGGGAIPPYAPLVFEVELLAVDP